tara:strand:+ start:2291 stop:2743 length:453 start_codon:yes stop_codon:yes gene_type:complete
MTLKKSKVFLKTLISESNKSKEIKIYKKFIDVLTSIENREFSTYQIELIEKELTILNLKQPAKNKKRHIKQKLNQFVEYLDSEYSLILEDHYADLGMKIGLVLGMALGTFLLRNSGGSAIGMCFGILIGFGIGKYMDKEAAKQNQVLKIA